MKDLKISKELIKAVLQKETKTLSKDFNFTINEDYIEFSDDGEMQFEYCIYKFAFKCKEWAWFNKNYNIASFVGIEGFICCLRGKVEEDDISFYNYSEVEAIIKACTYILSEVNK